MSIQRTATVVLVLAAAPAAAPAVAETGFYVRTDLGVNAAPGLQLATADNDRPSRCDGFVNPQYALLPGCTDPNRSIDAVDRWTSDFGSASGLFAGAAVGYRFSPRLRLELEYAHRQAAYDERSNIVAPNGTAYVDIFGPEIPRAEERVGTAAAHHGFLNLLVDFPNESRATPYVGAGAGVAWMRLDYTSYWARAIDPATIATAAGLPNEEEVRRNLAGTVTLAQATLRDRLSGYQILAGVGIGLSDRLTLDVSARFVRFSRLEDGDGYVRLRSHVSNLRADGSEPVEYRTGTDDTGFMALSAGLRYDF